MQKGLPPLLRLPAEGKPPANTGDGNAPGNLGTGEGAQALQVPNRSHALGGARPAYAAAMRAESTCVNCGYSLAGLTAGKCPECGSDAGAVGCARRKYVTRVLAAAPAMLLVSLQVGAVTMGANTAGLEPFADMTGYLSMAVAMSGLAGLFVLVVLVGPVFLLFAAFASMRTVRWVSVAVAAMLAPSAVYTFACCATGARIPGFNLIQGTTPAWINAPVLDWLDSPLFLLGAWFALTLATIGLMKVVDPVMKPPPADR